MFNGQQIRELRKRMGLSQVALGSATGVSGTYISYLERAHRGQRPSYPFVLRLAQALDVEPAVILAT